MSAALSSGTGRRARHRRPGVFARAILCARQTTLWAVCLSCAALICAFSGVTPAHAAAPVQQEVEQALTCQCGCGLTVANCNHPNCPFAVPARKEIATMIDAGMSRAEIIAAFRKKYGEKVLSAPTTEGFNILAWTAPFIALGAGVLVVLITMGRWRAVPAQPASSAQEPLVADDDSRLREQLEEELRKRI